MVAGFLNRCKKCGAMLTREGLQDSKTCPVCGEEWKPLEPDPRQLRLPFTEFVRKIS